MVRQQHHLSLLSRKMKFKVEDVVLPLPLVLSPVVESEMGSG